jgi:hypothetical protein
MAQTVVTTDDLDGSGEAQTVEFSYAGKKYSIDLGKKNRTAFEKALKPYIDAATAVSGRTSTRSARTSSSGKSTRSRKAPKTDLAAVRAWAAEQGMSVSERGRIAGDVLDAYHAAH